MGLFQNPYSHGIMILGCKYYLSAFLVLRKKRTFRHFSPGTGSKTMNFETRLNKLPRG
jgi:hypothetical protein